MMEEKKSKSSTGFKVVVVLLVLNLLVSGGIVGYIANDSDKSEETVAEAPAATAEESGTDEYVLYIGLNDKDTYKQEIETDDAKDIVNKICIKYVDGYTAMDAKGGWRDEKDNLTQETSLVYMFQGATKEQVKQIMDEVITALNQNCILVETRNMISTYYDGTNEF